jgi:nucleotide-binding universal stress UspA family protein
MSAPVDIMRWVVGIDLRPHCHGAINFAGWLKAHDQTGQARFEALHVVENRLFELPESPSRVAVLGHAKQATIAALTARNAVDVFDHVDSIEGDDATEMLAAAGALATNSGLIIGRRAPEDDTRIIRLGKVARRLLRRLESPVFVVPPDLEHTHLGAGPILCAIDLDQHGVDLARFGERLGAVIGRPARLMHVLDAGDPIGLEYLPEAAWADLRNRERETGQAALETWREQAGLSAYALLAHGQTVPKLISAARELDACMILCGSRQLSLTQRMWTSSVGSALAAAAHLPVGVVPSVQPPANAIV